VAELLGLRPTAVMAVAPFAGSEGRHLHVFEKVRDTPSGFPRRAGLAVRKPLSQTSK
jgi:16S rRNA (guanine527-N7)-methyltransferase